MRNGKRVTFQSVPFVLQWDSTDSISIIGKENWRRLYHHTTSAKFVYTYSNEVLYRRYHSSFWNTLDKKVIHFAVKVEE